LAPRQPASLLLFLFFLLLLFLLRRHHLLDLLFEVVLHFKVGDAFDQTGTGYCVPLALNVSLKSGVIIKRVKMASLRCKIKF
jgi:hypothetical protein